MRSDTSRRQRRQQGHRCARGAALVALIAAPAVAAAQPNPTFTYGTHEEVKEVEWSASAEASLIATTGNSRATTLSGGAKAERKDGPNKVAGEVNGNYARSTIPAGRDLDMNGTIDNDSEIAETKATTAKNALGKLRYDRFLTESNSLYVSGQIGFDKPAGKDLFGGGQVGYSRQLYKTPRHEAKGEVGYDLTYENLTIGPSMTIHSARVFAGYKGGLRFETTADGKEEATTTAEASVEGLFNVNTLEVATGDHSAGPFEDTRINGMVGVTTKLLKNISLAVSFTAKFDNVPAPRPPIPGFKYGAGFVPPAEKLDTISKASLIVNFF
jgi:hypothetical protein